MQYRAYDILYDTDGVKVKLPTEMFFDSEKYGIDDPADQIGDLISDETGWCVDAFNFEIVPSIAPAP